MNRHLSNFVGGFVTLILLGNGVPAADWPTFRGNIAQTGVTADALPDKLGVRWVFKTDGSVPGTPAIVNGVVYAGSMDGSLYAIDLANGKQKWKFAAGAVKAAVGMFDGRVYAGNDDGVLHCVDAATGKGIWKFDAGAEITSAPSFAGEFVLFGCNDEYLHCLNRSDGQERWKFQVAGGPVMSTPLVIQGRTFATGCDSTLHALDLQSGKELSHVDLGGQVASSIAAVGNQLYATTMSGEILAIDAIKLTVTWRFESRRRQPFYGSPAVTEKLVIAPARDGRVYALDRNTGKEVWTFLAEKRIDGSPVVAGSRIYVACLDKQLYVLDLATGKELQKLLVDSGAASPAIANSCLLIGSDKSGVQCIGSVP